jgi:hypothetical protein
LLVLGLVFVVLWYHYSFIMPGKKRRSVDTDLEALKAQEPSTPPG